MIKKIIVLLILICLFIFFWSNYIIPKESEEYIFQEVSGVEKAQTALVLGARVWSNGKMSDIFKDRVDVAIELYNAGKVEKILVSGDHGQDDYDEVNAAKEYLLENNIKEDDVFLDHAGFDTYDSLYRARGVFEAESLIVVTQNFHLPRAVYIGRELGLDILGVSADLHTYVNASNNNLREKFARVKAWLNIVLKSKPKYLGDVISLSGSGLDSWD